MIMKDDNEGDGGENDIHGVVNDGHSADSGTDDGVGM